MLGSFQIVSSVYPALPAPSPIAIDLFVRLWEHVITGWAMLPPGTRLPVVPVGITKWYYRVILSHAFMLYALCIEL